MNLADSSITRNVIISSSRLSTIESCFFATHLHYNLLLRPVVKNEYLERGTLVTKLTEWFYLNRQKGLPYNECINEAVENGRALSIKLNLKIEFVEFIIERFIAYCHHYMNDGWEILGVEEPFTKIIYESEPDDLRIIAEGKIDLLVASRGIMKVVDTKSTSRAADARKINAQKLDNQFKLYCIVFDVHEIVINDFGVQKSKNEDVVFQRRQINYSPAVLKEWIETTAYWVNNWLNHDEAKIYPMNPASCYGCDYNAICAEEPDMRSFIIDRDFVVEKKFDIYKEKSEQK